MKVAIFWDIAPCSPYVNQRLGWHLLARWFRARLIFDPEDGGDKFLRNSDSCTDYKRYVVEDGNFEYK
jgi:hypothetical protein